MNRRIVEHRNATEFLGSCQEWLASHEIENHGLLSLAAILTPYHPIYDPPFLFAHVVSTEGMEGCCIYAEPDGLILSDLSDGAALALFDYLQANIDIPSRIFGPEKAALQLATLFADRRSIQYRIQSAWRVHYLTDLEDIPRSTKGSIRIGQNSDQELVGRWGSQYDDERPANVNIRQFLLKKLADRQVYLWEDESLRCLATISGANCTGPRISSVYTPPLFRSKGYATALVHTLCQKYLDDGSKYVTLNTQVGDPVERIYKKLGFLPLTKRLGITFENSSEIQDSTT